MYIVLKIGDHQFIEPLKMKNVLKYVVLLQKKHTVLSLSNLARVRQIRKN